jgi:hypothetical protein
VSTRSSSIRLAAWVSLFAVFMAALAVTAFALTRSSGPTPPKRSLAAAIHTALAGKPVAGVALSFSIHEHLLPGSSTLVSQLPASGATGRAWLAGGRARIQIHSRLGLVDAGFDGRRVTLWDHKTGTAYVLPLPRDHARHAGSAARRRVPATAELQTLLRRIGRGALLSGAVPGTAAGRPAYTVRVSPRRDAGLLGAAELAWDAQHGVPLRFAVYPTGSSDPAIEITVTHIRYGAVAAHDLAVSPSAGTRLVRVHLPARRELASSAHHAGSASDTGPAAVARAVGFRLAAPRSVAGLTRTAVRSVDLGSAPAALLVYGHGLGAIAVIEQQASAGGHTLAGLPAATIAGTRGRELETTLGTLVQFTRGGVTYTVAGFQPASVVTGAAGSLR